MNNIEFLRTEKGNLYAISKVLYSEFLDGDKLAVSYVKSLMKEVDETIYS